MKKQRGVFRLIGLIIVCTILTPLPSHADLASDDAFEGAVWELILEDYIELPNGIVQSITLTSHYLLTMENMRSNPPMNNVIKAYHLHDVDRFGNLVERFSLAMQVDNMNWEHGNGMAYNPNTGEVAVSLYTHSRPETRGSLFIMDPLTLSYIRTVHVSDDFNILGIGYDKVNDRYIIQTNHEANYAIMILNSDFEIIEFVGEFKDVNVGRNYQDLIVTGNYVLNWPLVLGTEVDNHIMVFCLERADLVAATPVDFGFEDTVTWNEPESIVEIEPGVFIASVTVVNNGVRMHRLYQTEVSMATPAEALIVEATETPQYVPAETSLYPIEPSSTSSLESPSLTPTLEGAETEGSSYLETLLPDSSFMVTREAIAGHEENISQYTTLQTLQTHLGTGAQAAEQYLVTGAQVVGQHLVAGAQTTGQLVVRGAQGMLSIAFRNTMIAVLTVLAGFALLQRRAHIRRERARLRRKSRHERDRFARMLREQEAMEEQWETLDDIISKYIEN